MDRAETVRLLRALYKDGGQSALTAACDDIRENGPLHDPEWVTCLDCDAEFERPQSRELNGGSHPLRCQACHLAALSAASIKRQRRSA